MVERTLQPSIRTAGSSNVREWLFGTRPHTAGRVWGACEGRAWDGKVDLPDLTRGFPSTGTFGANMASTVLLCHMTAKRWANVFAGGACGRTSHASRGGQTVYTFGSNVLLLWSCLNTIIYEHLSSQLGFACIRARAFVQDFVSRNWVRAVTWQLSLINPNCQLLFACLCRRSFQNQFCSSV